MPRRPGSDQCCVTYTTPAAASHDTRSRWQTPVRLIDSWRMLPTVKPGCTCTQCRQHTSTHYLCNHSNSRDSDCSSRFWPETILQCNHSNSRDSDCSSRFWPETILQQLPTIHFHFFPGICHVKFSTHISETKCMPRCRAVIESYGIQ